MDYSMKTMLIILLALVSFSSTASNQIDGFVKCSLVAKMLDLEADAELFEAAYNKLKGIEETDHHFLNMVYYTEGLILGFASGSGKDKHTVARNFYYANCDGTNKKYASDLVDSN